MAKKTKTSKKPVMPKEITPDLLADKRWEPITVEQFAMYVNQPWGQLVAVKGSAILWFTKHGVPELLVIGDRYFYID